MNKATNSQQQIKNEINKLEKAIAYHEANKTNYEIDSDWDYDDRGCNYESVL